MKLLLICGLVAVATAAPPSYNPENIQILKYENDNIGTGGFRYAYEQSDGTKQEAQGTLINEGQENAAVAVKGLYSYVVDGVTHTVTYTADENGYHPIVEQGGSSAPRSSASRSNIPSQVAALLG